MKDFFFLKRYSTRFTGRSSITRNERFPGDMCAMFLWLQLCKALVPFMVHITSLSDSPLRQSILLFLLSVSPTAWYFIHPAPAMSSKPLACKMLSSFSYPLSPGWKRVRMFRVWQRLICLFTAQPADQTVKAQSRFLCFMQLLFFQTV